MEFRLKAVARLLAFRGHVDTDRLQPELQQKCFTGMFKMPGSQSARGWPAIRHNNLAGSHLRRRASLVISMRVDAFSTRAFARKCCATRTRAVACEGNRASHIARFDHRILSAFRAQLSALGTDSSAFSFCRGAPWWEIASFRSHFPDLKCTGPCSRRAGFPSPPVPLSRELGTGVGK